MTDKGWSEAGARHEIDYGQDIPPGHWHEPNYPSCGVCRMRVLEVALDISEKLRYERETELASARRVIKAMRENPGLLNQDVWDVLAAHETKYLHS